MLEAASDRIEERFVAAVEAVRVGTITAHDKKSAQTWQRRVSAKHQPSRGLEGADLERVVMGLARVNPELVFVKVA